jgi:hypothetical protein
MIWQIDFSRRPLQDSQNHILWELVICDLSRSIQFTAICPQPQATAAWLSQQLQQAIAQSPGPPDAIQVFRPQCLSLVETACQSLAIPVKPTRRTLALKQELLRRSQTYPLHPYYTGQPYDPLGIDQPPPQPIPERLWGEHWQFVTLCAEDLETGLLQRSIPILDAPSPLFPSQLQLAPETLIPGMIIYGGRRSMPLARWLHQQRPVFLETVRAELSGLVLAAGLCARWVLVTYDDPDVGAAAQTFVERQQASQGLHFLMVQPDDSGVTFTGLWLLYPED